LRMKPDIRIVLQNNAIDSLSIPLRMKQCRYCRWKNQFCFSFNSFEDETLLSQSYVYIAIRVLLFFQFLWGWNLLQRLRLRIFRNDFQFLWGWNCTYATVKSRCKHSSFNSFEDETYKIRRS